MNIITWFENYSAFISKFGLFNGPKIAKQLFPKNKSNKVISVKIPHIATPIFVRLGTTDANNFQENFMQIEFPLPDYLTPQFIIDAGANVGYASLFLMNKFPEAKIISIEPEASNFKMLNKNCGTYPHFESLNSAVWVNDGCVKIVNPETGNTGFRVEETTSDDKDGLSAITIETILEKSGHDRIGLLKIDIEGAEKELFKANYKKWIDKVDVLIIELHDRFKPGCSATFYPVIESYDFVQYASGANLVYIRKALLKDSKA